MADPPPDYEITNYTHTVAIDGSSQSTFEIVCAWGDRAAIEALFLYQADPVDGRFICKRLRLKLMSGTIADADKVTISAECGLSSAVAQHLVDQPFKVRGSVQGHAITIAGSGYIWPDHTSVDDTNSVVLPVKEITRCELEFYGIRSTFDLTTYSALDDHVNSDVLTVAGVNAPLGTLLGKGTHFAPRASPGLGSETFDVSVHIAYSSQPWNDFWREGTPNRAHPNADTHAAGFEKPTNFDTGNPVYPKVAMSTLLTEAPESGQIPYDPGS